MRAYLTLLGALLTQLLWSQESILVNIRLYTPPIADSQWIYITGSHPELGNWDPGKVKMNKTRANYWSFKLSVADTGTIEYKYTLGSWTQEGTDSIGKVLGNFKIHVTKPAVFSDTVCCWRNGSPPASGSQVTGTVIKHKVYPMGLPERNISVWLPPGYEENQRARYPVFYMHDGQNVFDPSTSAFGVDWQVDETCDSLIKQGKIPPMIVVAIENGPERRSEYSPGEMGTAYMDFLCYQLKPMIDSTYRTKKVRKSTMVGGSSMGGLISFMLVWERGNIFSKAICMSPAFQYRDFDYLPKVIGAKKPKKKISVYIDNGGVDLEQVLQPGVDAMIKALRPHEPKVDFYWSLFSEDEHNEAAWARRMPGALLYIYGH